VTHIIRNTTRVLRGLFAFRLFMLVFGGIVLAIRASFMGPPQFMDMHPAWGWAAVPSLLTMVYMFIPGLQKRMGRTYLPLALAITILSLSLESSIAYIHPGTHVRVSLRTGREIAMAWTPTEMILMVLVPCILGGAAYGLRGALKTANWAVLLHLAAGVAVWAFGTSLRSFLVLLPLRIAVLYAFPLMTGYLSDTWRREHDALEKANHHLRGYAATAEHLAISHERVRLARAMHDTLAHSLASLVVQFEAVEALQETNPDRVPAQIAKIRQQARIGLDEARQAIQDLRSAPVEELGLAEAMCQLAHRSAEQSGLPVKCHVEGEPFPLLPAQANTLYRIAEEALSNVEIHARACELDVTLRYDVGVTLVVRDDGQGFDPDAIAPDRYGLVGIRERAELIDATVTLDTAPNQGTTVTIHIAQPWEA
jgi:signal transduction histidine kinase